MELKYETIKEIKQQPLLGIAMRRHGLRLEWWWRLLLVHTLPTDLRHGYGTETATFKPSNHKPCPISKLNGIFLPI